MNSELLKLFEELKQKGLTPQQEEMILRELQGTEIHETLPASPSPHTPGIYEYHDLTVLQDFPENTPGSYTVQIRSLDELLERDKQREQDGFPRKIRVGKLIKPGRGGKDKIVVVPDRKSVV
jgi:hypothetical protein